MAKWIDYPVDERRALVDNVAADKNIDQAAAEKDWWVTAVLYALFKSSIGPYALFKGGTSLSKVCPAPLTMTRILLLCS